MYGKSSDRQYIHTQFLLNFKSKKFLLHTFRQISQVSNPISRHCLIIRCCLHMWIILQYMLIYFFVVSFSFGVWLNVCGSTIFYIYFCEILMKKIYMKKRKAKFIKQHKNTIVHNKQYIKISVVVAPHHWFPHYFMSVAPSLEHLLSFIDC